MVITVDKHKRPLGFCSERRARILLAKRRACVYKYYPFTIIIKDVDAREVKPQEYQLKIDPGAKHTGMAIVRPSDNAVMYYLQIEHRGQQVVDNLKTRNAARRNRRQRETRYRKCKWDNHFQKKGSKYKAETPRPEGWLPPSIKSVGDNVINWAKKLGNLVNLTSCAFEAVRFDTQLLDDPDISGVEYQHGTLFGYELKEYLMEKYGHTCQYCGGVSEDTILEWEHIQPRSKGGSDSVKNATLACHCCNTAKGNKSLKEWLDEETQIKDNEKTPQKRRKLAAARVSGITRVTEGAPKKSTRYCTWVASSRRYVEKALFGIFNGVECASGGKTKYNRERLKLPKDHHYDALCVGTVPEEGYKDLTNGYCLYIKAMGRGSRLRGNVNLCGVITVKFPKGPKRKFGFQTGDIVSANVPNGKYRGYHLGRVMTRATGSFDIRTADTRVTVNHKYCKILQKTDGYQYFMKGSATPIPLGT